MSEINEVNQRKKDVTTKVLIALVSVMVVAIGILAYMLTDLSKRNKSIIVQNQEVGLEKDNLKIQLNSLYDDYDILETSNDSLNSEIVQEKEHILELIDELENVRNYSYSVQQKYEKELTSLRSIMRHYVFQIDSLDQMNKQLIAENIQVRGDHDRIKTEMDDVVEHNTELETVIEGASILKTAGISVKFLNKRGKDTEKSSKIKKIENSFTIVANDIAEGGSRRVYLRIIRPDGYTMSAGETFEFREKQIAYSAYRDVIYNNKNLSVSIFYDVTETLTTGKYTVEVYTDKSLIGKSFFTLEK